MAAKDEPKKPTKYTVLALYKFVSIPQEEIPSLKEEIESTLRSYKTRGTILLATEGVNGTICYPQSEAITATKLLEENSCITDYNSRSDDNNDERVMEEHDQVMKYFQNHKYFHGLRLRPSVTDASVFNRLKVKIKKAIVTMLHTDEEDPKGANCSGEKDETEHSVEEKNTTDMTTSQSSSLVDPANTAGIYVKPGKQWDDLLMDPDVVVIDTRNKYEIEIGTFENAVSPNTDNFRQFPDWLHRFAKTCEDRPERSELEQAAAGSSNNDTAGGQCVVNNETVCQALESDSPVPITTNTNARCTDPVPVEDMPKITSKPKGIAMFCTGGIRCEKSTSYTINSKVFPPDVPIYHLDGGILAYLDANPDADKSKWKGECFVFDQRVSVTHGLKPSANYDTCHACRWPVSEEDKKGDDYIEGICCKNCKDDMTDQQKKRFQERQKQVEIAKTKGIPHIYDPKELAP